MSGSQTSGQEQMDLTAEEFAPLVQSKRVEVIVGKDNGDRTTFWLPKDFLVKRCEHFKVALGDK